MLGTIVGIISVLAILTGCGFYFIPKYAMSTSNGWIVAVDKSISWIGSNWIVFTIMAVLLIALIITLIVVSKRCK